MILFIPNADNALLTMLRAINEKMSEPYKLQIDENQEQYLGDADIENFKELLKKKAKGELKFYSQAEFSDKMVQKGYKW
ncbi:hypothetical protein [Campylobacter curvus]|uniref:hypothetical protein n=1 Tax=Campylobacter curvus TaxID=200 RepID=UPI00035D30AF|nr:hypothetical protein [Campylobacter curvus]QKF60352.1 hypothetical protein CCVT_0016 [Campylobacter curvus]UEB50487.1 hypothetical protein LK426_03275 [Campylobacter curvus]